MSPGEVVASVLMLSGVSLTLLGTLGLQQFPDVFARMHAATKPVTLGLGLLVVGAAVVVPDPSDTAKLLLVASLQLITAPISAHMVGRAAYRAGTELSPETSIDELAGVDLGAGVPATAAAAHGPPRDAFAAGFPTEDAGAVDDPVASEAADGGAEGVAGGAEGVAGDDDPQADDRG